jgi:hypothetical protein
LLCSRFYVPEDTADNSSRNDLFVRGLRRAVSLYKALIEERSYRGPARRNLARCLKRIAEQTGEKSDFSDFGYGLNAFPADEELADEALAARQPASQDRFLWQWLLADEELFSNVERLNLAEYRTFWIEKLESGSGRAAAIPAGDEGMERSAAAIRAAHHPVQCHFPAPGAL